MSDHDDLEGAPLTPVQIGTVRMTVRSVGPSPGSRQELKAFCRMLELVDPFVSVTVTVMVPEGYYLDYKVGDEFDLPFGQAIRTKAP